MTKGTHTQHCNKNTCKVSDPDFLSNILAYKGGKGGVPTRFAYENFRQSYYELIQNITYFLLNFQTVKNFQTKF